MKCPVCSIALKEVERGCSTCPNGHGLILSASKLIDSDKEFAAKVDAADVETLASTDNNIACPNCGKPMHKVDYNSTGFIIDSCTSCHFRWFDRGELTKIENHNLIEKASAEGLLFLTKFDSESKSVQSDDINPKAPGYHSVKGGIVRGYASTDSRKTLSFMGASVLAGIAKAMVHSRFWRIVGPLVILAMLLGLLLIVKQMQLIDWSM